LPIISGNEAAAGCAVVGLGPLRFTLNALAGTPGLINQLHISAETGHPYWLDGGYVQSIHENIQEDVGLRNRQGREHAEFDKHTPE
jgi:hypothetical protein